MSNVKLIHTLNDGDLVIKDGAICMDGGLESAVYLSLFGGNSDGVDWWGNIGENDPDKRYISETQRILVSLPLTVNNLRRLVKAIERDLNWLDAVKDINVEIVGVNRVNMTIKLTGDQSVEFAVNWGASDDCIAESQLTKTDATPPEPETIGGEFETFYRSDFDFFSDGVNITDNIDPDPPSYTVFQTIDLIPSETLGNIEITPKNGVDIYHTVYRTISESSANTLGITQFITYLVLIGQDLNNPHKVLAEFYDVEDVLVNSYEIEQKAQVTVDTHALYIPLVYTGLDIGLDAFDYDSNISDIYTTNTYYNPTNKKLGKIRITNVSPVNEIIGFGLISLQDGDVATIIAMSNINEDLTPYV